MTSGTASSTFTTGPDVRTLREHNYAQRGKMASQRTLTQKQQRRQRHRFTTNFALALTGATLLLIALVSSCFSTYPSPPSSSSVFSVSSKQNKSRNLLDDNATSHLDGSDYCSYSCDHLYLYTSSDDRTQQCQYARTCNDGDGVFAPIVFCSTRYSTSQLAIFLAPGFLLALTVLFRMLGSTAEDFFSPGLEMFSLRLGLPSRFAGVTLLALGNGAPDIAATVSSMMHDHKIGYQMALGEITGSVMVIATVVAGVVIMIADGVACRGGLLRDVGMLFITTGFVFAEFQTGVIGPWAISCFIAMYAMYVLVVLAADLYHRHVVGPRVRKLAMANTSTHSEVKLEGMHTVTDTNAAFKNISTDSCENGTVGSTATCDVEVSFAPNETTPLSPLPVQVAMPCSLMHNKLNPVLEALSNYAPGLSQGETTDCSFRPTTRDTGWGMETENGTEPLVIFHSHPVRHSHVAGVQTIVSAGTENINAMDDNASKRMHTLRKSNSWSEAVNDGKEDFVQHWIESCNDLFRNEDNNMLDTFLLMCEFPFIVLRKITVPIPCDEYYCRSLVAMSIMISPLWLAWYLNAQSGLNIFVAEYIPLFLVPIFVGLLVARFAPSGEGPMPVFVSVPITLYGFIIAATYLDAVADKLVDILSFIGIICHIPSQIMGLTILAWGNSLGDLSANVAVANKGLADMAITACFAGPVFNMLIGPGIGFWLLGNSIGVRDVPVDLTPPLEMGFVFSMLNCVLVAVYGLCGCSCWEHSQRKGWIQKEYGYAALVLYMGYIVASLSWQYM